MSQEFELLKKSAITEISSDLENQVQLQLSQWEVGRALTESGDFDTGFTATERQQIFLYNGEWYRWDGELPKSVSPSSTPASTGGVVVGAWRSVGDAALRQDLADPARGSKIVRYDEKNTVYDAINRNREDFWANKETMGGTYTHYVREDDGTPVAGAECAVYVGKSGVLATGLKDKFGEPLANPFVTGANGLVQFVAEPGMYTLQVSFDLVVHTYSVYFADEQVRADLANPDMGAALVARGVVAVDSIDGLLALPEGQRKEGLRYIVKGYHVGSDAGGGEFYWDQSSAAPSNGGTVIEVPSEPTGRWKRLLSGPVTPQMFGAVADGVTDDTVAIQTAIDSIPETGGTLLLPAGEYRISRNVGVNDRWGLNISKSNITVIGQHAKLRRFDVNISTYGLAYPLIFIGAPDDDGAPATQNVCISGVEFVGEDTNHGFSGNSVLDFRTAISLRNTKGAVIKECVFNKIDSSAIEFRGPGNVNYVNGTAYNRTKNYNCVINNNTFNATPHNVRSRALIHVIDTAGCDHLIIEGNIFTWCDVCVSGETTYNNYSDKETDMFSHTSGALSLLGPLLRSGRYLSITNNQVFNSSEHCFYNASMDVSIIGNTIGSDRPDICTENQIQIRGRGVVCTGNRISNCGHGISIMESARDVVVSDNIISLSGIDSDSSAGAITIKSQGITSYITNRPAFYVDGAPDLKPVSNISITGNIIEYPPTAAESGEQHVAFTIYTDTSDANYPSGQLQNVTISGNTIKNHNVGVMFYNGLLRGVNITNNTFHAKPFTESGFNSSSTLNTRAVLQAFSREARYAMQNVKFSGNYVNGSTYLFATLSGDLEADTVEIPQGFVGNRLDYIKNFRTVDIRPAGSIARFSENTGVFFLDRTVFGNVLNNSLSSGSYESGLRGTFHWTGNQLRYYTDDNGSFLTLGEQA